MAILGALGGVRVLTELLDPAAYGELALGMTAATLVNQAIFGPLGQGASRFFAPANDLRDVHGYAQALRKLLIQATWISALLILAAVIGMSIAGNWLWLPITLAALVLAIFGGYNSVLIEIQNAARQRSIVAMHQGMLAWARVLVAAAVIILFGATSTNAIYGYALATLLVLGSQAIFIRKIMPRPPARDGAGPNWRSQLLSYSWPFGLWGIFYWAQTATDRWALGIFETSEAVGLYAVLFQVGYFPMSVATGLAIQFVAPILFQRAGDASDARRNAGVTSLTLWLAVLAIALTGIAFLLALAFHQAIFFVLVASDYWAVSELLPWMILAGGLFAAGQVMSLKLMSLMKTRELIPMKIVTASVGIIFNFIGAYWYGTVGVVAAIVVFAMLYFSWSAILFARIKAAERSTQLKGNAEHEKAT